MYFCVSSHFNIFLFIMLISFDSLVPHMFGAWVQYVSTWWYSNINCDLYHENIQFLIKTLRNKPSISFYSIKYENDSPVLHNYLRPADQLDQEKGESGVYIKSALIFAGQSLTELWRRDLDARTKSSRTEKNTDVNLNPCYLVLLFIRFSFRTFPHSIFSQRTIRNQVTQICWGLFKPKKHGRMKMNFIKIINYVNCVLYIFFTFHLLFSQNIKLWFMLV